MMFARTAKAMLAGVMVLGSIGIPMAAHASAPTPAVSISTMHPNLDEQVTFRASGLIPTHTYIFGEVTGYFGFVGMVEAVADSQGNATATARWGAYYVCQDVLTNCPLYQALSGVLQATVAVVDVADTSNPRTLVASLQHVNAGKDNKMGRITISGPGYVDGHFVAGNQIHISGTDIGNGITGQLTIFMVPTEGDTVDDFWNSVYASAPSASLGQQVAITAGAVDFDVRVPGIAAANWQVMFWWMGNTGDVDKPIASGGAVRLETMAGLVTSPDPSVFISSITQYKSWAVVDFTLPTLSNGKYDRVAYSVNGGRWIRWGAYAKSTQNIKGLKLRRTYSIRLRAHVQHGTWTGPSDPATITMNKLR